MLRLNKDSLLCWQQEAIKGYYAVSELHGQPSWTTGAVSQGSSGGDKVINFITHIVLSIHINLERNNGKNILPSKQPNEQIFMVEVKWNCYVAKHKIKLYPWKYVSQPKFTRKKLSSQNRKWTKLNSDCGSSTNVTEWRASARQGFTVQVAKENWGVSLWRSVLQ